MKRAIVQISKKFMEDAILPKGTKIIRVLPEDPHYNIRGVFEILVEHEDFDETGEGCLYPNVMMGFENNKKVWDLS